MELFNQAGINIITDTTDNIRQARKKLKRFLDKAKRKEKLSFITIDDEYKKYKTIEIEDKDKKTHYVYLPLEVIDNIAVEPRDLLTFITLMYFIDKQWSGVGKAKISLNDILQTRNLKNNAPTRKRIYNEIRNFCSKCFDLTLPGAKKGETKRINKAPIIHYQYEIESKRIPKYIIVRLNDIFLEHKKESNYYFKMSPKILVLPQQNNASISLTMFLIKLVEKIRATKKEDIIKNDYKFEFKYKTILNFMKLKNEPRRLKENRNAIEKALKLGLEYNLSEYDDYKLIGQNSEDLKLIISLNRNHLRYIKDIH